MIRHVSVLTFAEDITPGQIAAIEDALRTLPGRLPVQSYSLGPDLGIDAGNGSFAVVAEFATQADYETYRDDPEHRRILSELIRPHLASRAAAQF